MNKSLRVDDEFQNIIPPLTSDEYINLEKSIITEGCRDAIRIWDGVIVDGHNRYKICQKWNIPFQTIDMSFSSREAAISWICLNQMSRRNLTREAYKYLIGKRYDAEKAIVRNAKGKNQYSALSNDNEHGDQNSKIQNTSARLAREYHLTHSTIERYSKYSRSLDKIERKRPGILPSLLSGECKISQRNIATLANMPGHKVKKVIEAISETGDKSKMVPLKDSREVVFRQQQNDLAESKKEQLVTKIKEMPQYNPDSELNGLTYTIPTWIDMLNRIKGIPIRHASEKAKRMMRMTLADLQDAINNLKKEMDGER